MRSRKFSYNGKQLTASITESMNFGAFGSAIPAITQETLRFEDSDGTEFRKTALPVEKLETLSFPELKALYDQATILEV